MKAITIKMCNLDELKEIITNIYNNTINNKEGNVADYIPQLAQVNPDLYGISFCSINFLSSILIQLSHSISGTKIVVFTQHQTLLF